MRDLLVTAIVFGCLPFALIQPWFGVLVWSWLGYMNPHRLTWGFAQEMPFAQMIGGAILVGLLFTKERRPIPWRVESVTLALLWAVFTMTSFSALNPAEAWIQWEKVTKIFLMTFVTMILFQDRRKLRLLLLVIALSIGFFGFKGGIFAILTGGREQVLGPPESFIGGNTEIALALIMVLPVLLFLAREEERRWLRFGLRLTFVLSVIAVLATYSRGGLIGLLLVLLLLLRKSRVKVLALCALLLGGVIAYNFLPEQWFGRMSTITEYEQEPSAVGRLMAWKVAVGMALDRPFTGGGFEFWSREVFQRYLPGYRGVHDAHSIYFEILGEHGFVALALFLGVIFSTLWSLARVRRVARRDPELAWAVNYSEMITTSLLGYLVSGAFLGLAYFDLFYHLVAIALILRTLVARKDPWPVSGTLSPVSVGWLERR
ncbi:MAG: putative O-glycosylation ligase, exosortase A system-associated [Candidatus Rokuibacteriota bacterium]